MSKNLKTQWRVEVKRKGKWVKKGLFETRSVARLEARVLRHMHCLAFGTTRVVKYIKA